MRPFLVTEWLGLDAFELEAGRAQGRPRVKVVEVAEMLRRGRSASGADADMDEAEASGEEAALS